MKKYSGPLKTERSFLKRRTNVRCCNNLEFIEQCRQSIGKWRFSAHYVDWNGNRSYLKFRDKEYMKWNRPYFAGAITEENDIKSYLEF